VQANILFVRIIVVCTKFWTTENFFAPKFKTKNKRENKTQKMNSQNDDFDDFELELAAKGGHQNIVQSIKQAFLNERFSPEILAYNTNITSALKFLQRRQNMLLAEESDQNDPNHKLRENLSHLELHRILFLVNSYLRTRLFKIEKYSQHIQKNMSTFEKLLSQQEINFANKYVCFFFDYVPWLTTV